MKSLMTMFALVMGLVSADAFAVLKNAGVATKGFTGRNATLGVKGAGVGTIATPLKKNNYLGKHKPENSVENGGLCTMDLECKSGWCKNEVCTAEPTSSDTNSPKSSN